MSVKEASPETINRVRSGWEQKREELFARDGTDSRNLKGLLAVKGNIGQDFLNNEALRKTVDGMAKSYIPLSARKLELREQRLEIQQSGVIQSRELNKIELELAALDEQLVLIHNRALKKWQKDGSGFQVEAGRHINELPQDVAIRILGSILKSISDGIHSPAVAPLDGVFPRRFQVAK